MEDNPVTPVSPPPAVVSVPPETTEKQGGSKAWIFILVAVVVLGAIGFGFYSLIVSSPETTGHWRDIFIIVMALESLVIGVALVVLIVQIATLINLLQNEVKPILNSTNETVNTLRGTVAFLSENLTEPVIKLNASLAGLKKFFDLIKPGSSRR